MANRHFKLKWVRALVLCIISTIVVSLLISLVMPDSTGITYSHSRRDLFDTFVQRQVYSSLQKSTTSVSEHKQQILNASSQNTDYLSIGRHKLAVIVPYRDRLEELLEFVPHIHKFLTQKSVAYEIYVINQVDSWRFNRASLINVGFVLSQPHCDYIAMHDVDLLPVNPALPYHYPQDGPLHVAAPELHPLYHYRKFIGGILLLTAHHFRLVNGLSNRFWGWGREDDEFYLRIRNAGLKVFRPVGITTGLNTFRHVHDGKVHKRDNRKSKNQRQASGIRDTTTGLNTLIYNIDSMHNMTIEGAPLLMVNVRLYCNVTDTPWCIKPENVAGERKKVMKVT